MITRRSVAIGEVSVVRRRIDVSGATFRVRLNNHQVNLTGDDAAASTLTVAGTAWTAPWSGDGPGGHTARGRSVSPPPVERPVRSHCASAGCLSR
jgi:hypothetical protein